MPAPAMVSATTTSTKMAPENPMRTLVTMDTFINFPALPSGCFQSQSLPFQNELTSRACPKPAPREPSAPGGGRVHRGYPGAVLKPTIGRGGSQEILDPGMSNIETPKPFPLP